MDFKHKPRVNLTKKLKLIGRDPRFVFKRMNFSYFIRYEIILTYELIIIFLFIVSIPQLSMGIIGS